MNRTIKNANFCHQNTFTLYKPLNIQAKMGNTEIAKNILQNLPRKIKCVELPGSVVSRECAVPPYRPPPASPSSSSYASVTGRM